MTIKILDSDDGQFYYKTIGDNGENLNTSEMYTRKEKCIESAKLMQNANFEIGDFTVRKKAVKTVKKKEIKLAFDLSRVNKNAED